MIAVFTKEIRAFLSSLIAFIVVGVFLTAIALYLWIDPDTNVLAFGYANLDTLFFLAPWVFIFLISAITMRSFSDEKKNGTIEMITTHAITDLEIIIGKYLAAMVLVLFSILPTLIYYYSIYQLGDPVGNLDTGAIIGSYIGLFFLGSCYVSIGLFASVLSSNQIVSFIASALMCFFSYLLFEKLSNLSLLSSLQYYIEWLGIAYHYDSISRGVIDTRDILYFISFTLFFLLLTQLKFGSRKWS